MNILVVCDCDCWHETADWSCMAVSYCTLFMAALCCMAYRWLIHVALSWAALLDVCNHTVERRGAGLASREAMLLSLRGGGGVVPHASVNHWLQQQAARQPLQRFQEMPPQTCQDPVCVDKHWLSCRHACCKLAWVLRSSHSTGFVCHTTWPEYRLRLRQ